MNISQTCIEHALKVHESLGKTWRLEENVRKYVEELLEAMSQAAGVEQREQTLRAAVEYTIPAELLKRYEVELEELKNLHASISQGDPEVLRECIEKCEVLGIKVVELLEVPRRAITIGGGM